VRRDFVIGSCPQYVVPQLLTLSFSPRVGALIYRNQELGRLLEKFEELGFGCFHTASPKHELAVSVAISAPQPNQKRRALGKWLQPRLTSRITTLFCARRAFHFEGCCPVLEAGRRRIADRVRCCLPRSLVCGASADKREKAAPNGLTGAAHAAILPFARAAPPWPCLGL